MYSARKRETGPFVPGPDLRQSPAMPKGPARHAVGAQGRAGAPRRVQAANTRPLKRTGERDGVAVLIERRFWTRFVTHFSRWCRLSRCETRPGQTVGRRASRGKRRRSLHGVLRPSRRADPRLGLSAGRRACRRPDRRGLRPRLACQAALSRRGRWPAAPWLLGIAANVLRESLHKVAVECLAELKRCAGPTRTPRWADGLPAVSALQRRRSASCQPRQEAAPAPRPGRPRPAAHTCRRGPARVRRDEKCPAHLP